MSDNPTSDAGRAPELNDLHPVIFELYGALPRQGPGDDPTTMAAWRLLTQLPPGPRVLNIGCGKGADTLALLRGTNATVTAIDIHEPYIQHLRDKAALEGFRSRLKAEVRSMNDLAELFETPFDVIWAEGSIFLLGFEEGLKQWYEGLAGGGYLVVSDLVLIDEEAHEDVINFWDEVTGDVAELPERLAQAKAAGYKIIKTIELPVHGWWDPFFYPMEDQLEALREKYKGDDEALAILDHAEKEMDMFEEDDEAFAYVFFVLQKPRPVGPVKKRKPKKKS